MAKSKTEEMSFLEHLEELRWHLVRSILSVFVGAIAAFIFKDIIFDKIILAPKSPDFFTNVLLCNLGKRTGILQLCINTLPLEIISIKMAGQFSMHIMVSLIVGLIIAFPYVFYQFWDFIAPALHSQERRHARGAVFFSSLLFSIGVSFGYFVITPLTIHFLGSYSVSSEVTNQINLISYVSTTTSVILSSGVIFELPVLVYFLTKIGLITPEFMRKYRRHSLVVILILSAIITPPDVFSQVLVAIPLIVLYEVSIFISKRIVKKQAKEDKKNMEETA